MWNHTRRAVDDRTSTPGLYILTGSSTPNDEVRRHSGAGRISVIAQRTMSLFETHHSSGAVSLREILGGDFSTHQSHPMTVPEMVERIVIGGWPALLDADEARAMKYLRDYLANTAHLDVPTLIGPRRSPDTATATMQSIARNTATEVKVSEIAKDVGVDRDTIPIYLDALHRLRLVEEQPAWRTHLRSKATLRSSPKQHFVDPSLAAAALGASTETLLHDLNTTGFLFESLVVRDLRIYAQIADATVYHYRDSSGREADAIVQDRRGRWCAVEVQLGQGQIDAAAANLHHFAETIDTTKVGEPAALIVVTVGDIAYRRPDGVLVVPINALGS
ncbi:ATP-binding protein [Corynebacterium cystitidis]|uniref:ATP-binding protein n=1 Tax=Corynebacterium cystitidis TaxID=35757 RepID=UPI00211DEF30|nr:DUF4143 domain-containing protein [Corynebacterium cystitidis]